VLTFPLTAADRSLLTEALQALLTERDTNLEATALQRCLTLQAELQR
jgi:hypothetical protein